jgi:pyrroloquinoline quinone (PQQ) biosynthesis protein C
MTAQAAPSDFWRMHMRLPPSAAALSLLAALSLAPALSAAAPAGPGSAALDPLVSQPDDATRPPAAVQARRLLASIRAELAPIEEEIRNAPYLAALERGEVSRDNLRAFAGEQYHIIQSDLRSAAQMTARFGATPDGPFFKGIIDSEILIRDLLLDFAAALGWSEADLQAYEPRPRAQTYPSYVTWLSVHGSAADIAASFAVNFPVFGENTGRMGEALRSRYGFTAEETAYFDFLAFLPPSFETEALAIVARGLDDGATRRAIRRSARLLQAYEKDFWDAVAEE